MNAIRSPWPLAVFALALALSPPVAGGERLANAALAKYGARVEVEWGEGAGRNARTPPEHTFDHNAHSRCVLWGKLPYTFAIELLQRLPVARMAFAHSDYAKERAPKDVVIELDDGTRIEHTLELKRPQRRRPAWQEVPVGKEARVIRVTVTSVHEGEVNWGGLAEIAVLTPVDLDELLAVPHYDPDAPAFVNPPALKPAGATETHLPEVVPPGEFPCTLFSEAEVAELREAVRTQPRAKEPYEKLLAAADAMVEGELDFPDPKGPPAQLKDRRDAPARAHQRLSQGCGTLAMAYALTGQRRYAERAKAILVGYAQRYELYPEHKGVNRSDTGKVMAQRLSEAMWLIPLIRGYELIHDGGLLTDDERQGIEQKLIRPCVRFIYRKSVAQRVADRQRQNPNWRTEAPPPRKRRGPIGNWLNFYAAAAITAGAVLGDGDLVDLTVHDVKGYIRDGISQDGMWGEGAIGYQLFALQALTVVLETAARQGHDLWGYRGCRIKMPFDSVLRYAYPDGTAPGINDSGRVRLGNWATMIYDYAWLRYRDPGYAYLVNASPRQLFVSEGVYYPTRIYRKLPEPEAVTYPSTVFHSTGYAILRDPGRYFLLDYGRHGGVHGHFDKLNLLAFAGGDELGGEPVMHRYEDPLHGQWTRHTVAHNTLAADGRSQLACTGKLLVFEDAGPIKVMRGEAAGAYPGVLLDRTVVVCPDAIVDLYHARSQHEHTWDRTLRFHGTLDGHPGLEDASEPLGRRDGYQHLKVGKRWPVDEKAGERLAWTGPAGKLHVALAGVPGQEVLLCRGPDDDHVALARQQAPRASFACVYWLDAWSEPPRSVAFADAGEPLVAALTVEGEEATLWVVVAHRPGRWKALGWASDARVLVARESGGRTRVLMAGGTAAEKGGQAIRLDAAGSACREWAP
ncbi:MAG: alginate lyase family protein [Candidatus Brocadiia bacterium]